MAPKATRSRSAAVGDERTPSEETPQGNEGPQKTTSALEQQLQEARAELARLQQEKELRSLQEKILRMRDVSDEPTPSERSEGEHEDPLPDPLEPPTAVYAKEIEPEKLPFYHGKNVREHKDWTYDALNAFRLAPRKFHAGYKKVSWAAQFLRGTPKTLWNEHERTLPPDSLIDWDYFSEFLLDQIEDPVNRELDALQAYEDAKQREGQTTATFNSYLLTLESQLPDLKSERERRNGLLTKLRPDIRAALNNLITIPQTRDGVVTTATRLENNKKRLREYQSTTKPDKKSKLNARDQKEKPKGTDPKGNQTKGPFFKGITCFNCQKEGHYSSSCPNPQKAKRGTSSAPSTNSNHTGKA